MSEKDKEILKTIAEALPNMPERDKGYFLGYAEAMAAGKENSKENISEDTPGKEKTQEE